MEESSVSFKTFCHKIFMVAVRLKNGWKKKDPVCFQLWRSCFIVGWLYLPQKSIHVRKFKIYGDRGGSHSWRLHMNFTTVRFWNNALVNSGINERYMSWASSSYLNWNSPQPLTVFDQKDVSTKISDLFQEVPAFSIQLTFEHVGYPSANESPPITLFCSTSFPHMDDATYESVDDSDTVKFDDKQPFCNSWRGLKYLLC